MCNRHRKTNPVDLEGFGTKFVGKAVGNRPFRDLPDSRPLKSPKIVVRPGAPGPGNRSFLGVQAATSHPKTGGLYPLDLSKITISGSGGEGFGIVFQITRVSPAATSSYVDLAKVVALDLRPHR